MGVRYMGYKDEKLWACLEEKVRLEDEKVSAGRRTGNRYLTGVEDVCRFGVDRAITIRDTFPMYTLHDETHICNVLRLMADLLGDQVNNLTRDETAMLIMAACCHDIGMSYSDTEKKMLLEDYDKINKYLEQNRREYVKAYAGRTEKPVMTDDMIQNYLRSLHHERVKELFINRDWTTELTRWVKINDLIRVCQSHGMDISSLDKLKGTSTIDLRLCAVLLRLADILDFDTSRAPQAVYEYSGFDKKEGDSARISKEEWGKHLSSFGFDFEHIPDRSIPYLLDYSAESRSIQVEQVINSYLDWVDQELEDCNKIIARYVGKWSDFVLPAKINRNIEHIGYVSGQYHLSLDHKKVMELLTGNNLYNDPAVFVRELLQNAIDAVRTRERMDKNLPADWKPQINIRTWVDEEGDHWFRIEDNGTGMSEEIILNYLLKVGSSYYTSDLFEQDKIRCKVDPDYTPISRFGIGILSCFMGDKDTNQVEISTKRFQDGSGDHSALRLSMHGMEGFYYMAKKEEGHNPGAMKGVTAEEKNPYLNHAGTAIAVRANLYQMRTYRSFKEIVDCYIFFPQISIHYDGEEGSYDYPTESEFMENICNPQRPLVYDIPTPTNELEELRTIIPDIFLLLPKISIEFIPFNHYIECPYLSGISMVLKYDIRVPETTISFGELEVKISILYRIFVNKERDKLQMTITMNSFDDSYYQLLSLIRNDYENCAMKNELRDRLARVINKDYHLTLYKLTEINLYRKYFYSIYHRSNVKELVAHNGIFCGDAKLFYDPNDRIIGSIYLLKDKFRPNVDFSRNMMQKISFETMCVLSVLFHTMERKIFLLNLYEHFSDMVDYPYCSAQECWKVLDKHDYLIPKLSFYAPHGKYSVEMIRSKLELGEHIQLYPSASIFKVSETKPLSTLYDFLCVAYLRKEFILKFLLVNETIWIEVVEEGCDMPVEQRNILPAYFFLPPSENTCPYLAAKSAKERCICNANHRLSRFILNNCVELNEYANGYLNKMLHILLEEEYQDVIKKINRILTSFRAMPNGLFNITDDLYLTEDDFI